MAKIDRVKEEIGWLKLVFGVLAVADLSLIGWLAQNHNKTEDVLIVGGVFSVVVMTVLGAAVVRRVYRCLKDLEV